MKAFRLSVFTALAPVYPAVEFMLFNMSWNEFIFFFDQFLANEVHFTAAFVTVPCRSAQQIVLRQHREFGKQFFAGILFPLMRGNLDFLSLKGIWNG